jgi:hypothetical protein
MISTDSTGVLISDSTDMYLNSGVPCSTDGTSIQTTSIINTFPTHGILARNMCKLLKLIVEDAPSISSFEMTLSINSGETPRLTVGFLMGKTVVELTAFIVNMENDEQFKLLKFFQDHPHNSIVKCKEAIGFVFDAEIIQTIYIKTKDETQVIHPNLAFGVGTNG